MAMQFRQWGEMVSAVVTDTQDDKTHELKGAQQAVRSWYGSGFARILRMQPHQSGAGLVQVAARDKLDQVQDRDRQGEQMRQADDLVLVLDKQGRDGQGRALEPGEAALLDDELVAVGLHGLAEGEAWRGRVGGERAPARGVETRGHRVLVARDGGDLVTDALDDLCGPVGAVASAPD